MSRGAQNKAVRLRKQLSIYFSSRIFNHYLFLDTAQFSFSTSRAFIKDLAHVEEPKMKSIKIMTLAVVTVLFCTPVLGVEPQPI